MTNDKIPTRVTYLEMKSPPRGLHAPKLPPDIKIIPIANPTVAFYRFLYDRVGGNFLWSARKLLSDEELQAIIQHPSVEIHVLHVHGTPGGYIELDCRTSTDIEIAYFGIFPEFYGRRLGRLLLDWGLHYLWSKKKPSRVWVHTCTLDHPKALETYLNAGFSPYKEQDEFVDKLA